jgi:hypothetical protein
VERQESNLRLLGASEVLCHQSFIPKVRTDGVEPPQPEAPRLQRGELTCAQRPHEGVADRIRTDTAGVTTPGACRYTTATMDGDDRNRTGDRSPDKRVLLPSELRPQVAQVGFEPTVSSS